MTSGIVFDIQRFALHDGPGIRTTIFLKGCPLHCIWCHNPESFHPLPQLSFNKEKCTLCDKCVSCCPRKVHSIKDFTHSIDFDQCNLCGACVKNCPSGALDIIGKEMDAEAILDEVLKDKDYYTNSGGGVTISGGEPMRQYAFTKSILIRLKENNLHTCLDTCGYAPSTQYREIAPLTDIFLFDYKASGAQKHKELTGVSPELILDNLNLLNKLKASIILRCPMIPGVNDSDEHLLEITRLSNTYESIQSVEIMAFHNMAREKASRVGMRNTLEGMPTADEEIKTKWIDKLHLMGCNKSIIG